MPLCYYNSITHYATPCTIAFLIAGTSLLLSCSDGKRDAKPPTGAATIEELIQRYRRAHDHKDMEDLRGILIWESQLPHHRPPLEKPMLQLFEMPLAEVRYVSRPTIPDEIGGEAVYDRPNGTSSGMIGPLCGKMLLVEKAASGKEPRVLDPSYIVVCFREFDGRYYMDVLQDVAEDAARAYKTNTPQAFPAQPMTPMKKNPFK